MLSTSWENYNICYLVSFVVQNSLKYFSVLLIVIFIIKNISPNELIFFW
jgi:hypothetical protein